MPFIKSFLIPQSEFEKLIVGGKETKRKDIKNFPHPVKKNKTQNPKDHKQKSSTIFSLYKLARDRKRKQAENRNLSVSLSGQQTPQQRPLTDDLKIQAFKEYFHFIDQPKINRLLYHLKKKNDFITWDTGNLELIINGKRYSGSNLLDILTFLMSDQTKPSFFSSAKYDNPGSKNYGVPQNTLDFIEALEKLLPFKSNNLAGLFSVFGFNRNTVKKMEEQADEVGEVRDMERAKLAREAALRELVEKRKDKEKMERSLQLISQEENAKKLKKQKIQGAIPKKSPATPFTVADDYRPPVRRRLSMTFPFLERHGKLPLQVERFQSKTTPGKKKKNAHPESIPVPPPIPTPTKNYENVRKKLFFSDSEDESDIGAKGNDPHAGDGGTSESDSEGSFKSIDLDRSVEEQIEGVGNEGNSSNTVGAQIMSLRNQWERRRKNPKYSPSAYK